MSITNDLSNIIPDTNENNNALEQIQMDLDRILGKLNDSDNLLLQLEQKVQSYQQQQNELQEQIDKMNMELNDKNNIISQLESEKQTIQEKLNILEEEKINYTQQLNQLQDELRIIKESNTLGNNTSLQQIQQLEADKNMLENSILERNNEVSKLNQQLTELQKQYNDLENRIITLNSKKLTNEKTKEKNQKVIDKIKNQITTIEQKIVAQTSKIGDLGQFTISNKSSLQLGSSKRKLLKNKPIVSQVKVLQYLNLFPIIDKVSRSKLVEIAKLMNMDPKQYSRKKDLIVAIKLGLHCKAGIIKHSRELKIVGKNMQIIEIQHMKTKNEMCDLLSKKLSKLSLLKIQKILM